MALRKKVVTVKGRSEKTFRLLKAEATKTGKPLGQARRPEVWRERQVRLGWSQPAA